MPPVTSTIPE